MRPLEELVRPNIRALKPYSTARDEFSGGEITTWLDANENPYDNGVNRYPDPHQKLLKQKIAALKGVREEQVFIGNGSDEAIDLCYRIFCRPGVDNAVSIAPTYGMYRVAADINDVEMREVPLGADFSLPADALLAAADERTRLLWLCSPNNPTGSVYTKAQLREWVDYALANNAVIIFDAAYEAFITEANLPRSIYLVEGAKKCAIEICSLSKTAGFTGTRCGYTIVPDELIQKDSKGSDVKIADLWNRRQGSKFNGVSYPVQRAAEAVFTPEGQKQTKATIAYYQENARIIAKTCDELGIKYTGGINSPYIWLKSPNGMGSWEFFDYLLNEIQVVGTPGAGFGANGDGWFRLTAFSTHELTAEAMERFKTLFKK